jgi:hypothetical protein
VGVEFPSTLAFGLELRGVTPPWPSGPPEPASRRLKCRFSDGLRFADEPWWFEPEEQALVAGWRDYAEYRIDAAKGCVDVALGGIDEPEATLGLLLSALPLALPLFDLEPLHGSCVSLPGLGALVLLGVSGAGKSTLGAHLASLGADFLADDATAIDRQGRVVPGPPVANPRFLDAGQPAIGEYNGKVVRLVRHTQPQALAAGAIVVIDRRAGSPLSVEAISSREAFESVLANARIPWIFRERRQALQLAVAASLGSLPALRVRFDPVDEAVGRTADAVLEWAGRL